MQVLRLHVSSIALVAENIEGEAREPLSGLAPVAPQYSHALLVQLDWLQVGRLEGGGINRTFVHEGGSS